MLLFEASASFLSPTLAKAINLLIYVGILVFLLRKPMAAFFQNRNAEIEQQLKKAEREKEEALAKLKQVEERLNKLDAEIEEIKAQAAREAEAEYARIIAGAQDDATKLRELAQRELQSLTKAARQELKAYAAEEAVNLAEQVIRRELNQTDANRIIADYIDELEGARK